MEKWYKLFLLKWLKQRIEKEYPRLDCCLIWQLELKGFGLEAICSVFEWGQDKVGEGCKGDIFFKDDKITRFTKVYGINFEIDMP